jgi:N-acetylneuraminic acid mutarotase
MASSITIIISILMLFASPVVAQKSPSIILQWELASELPVDSNSHLQHALGFAGPVTGVHNNVFFVAGGANFPGAMPWNGGNKKFYNTVYVYTPVGKKIIPLKKSFQLPSAIAYPACCNTPIGVLFAGGENETGLSDKVWLMQWDSVTQYVNYNSLPSLPVPVSNAAATLVDHIVYISGGETATEVSEQMISLDLDNTSKGWTTLADVPHAVSHMVLIGAPGNNAGKIYLMGGRKKNCNGISDLYADVFEYDISKNTWNPKTPLPYALCAGTGISNSAGDLILFGGDKGTTFHKVETLMAAISAEKDETKKQELILKKNKLQAEHPGFSRELLLYNVNSNLWKVLGTFPFDVPVTTTAVKWGSQVLFPSGEIKAGVRSPYILAAKILQKTK